ncbi:ATP-binding protein [Lewinella sp. 4G2]|uniref:ATP-binding protein n=1 Tax=Lewinella sp. 4G2 TaxID=1803372 RepID=UPI0007B4C2D5|nr:ATP-binding protein [Lewinella sp. 4G2]OAV44041.1 hypothetical protein A3850_005820 [Lewinella sp. 4G2]
MEFYGREAELEQLQSINSTSRQRARMTIITGRRRVGKTRLIKQSLGGQPFLYFFLSRKEEPLLCRDFQEQTERLLGVKIIGSITRFSQLFEWLCDYAQRAHLNLVIDEFQEFFRLNPAVYSEIQNHWDQYKDTMKMNLILSGSIQSLMQRIFENYQEPLFGRATAKIVLKPFSPGQLRKLLELHYPDFTARDLLTFFAVTGGVPRYVEYFVDSQALTHDGFINAFLDGTSFFRDEGKALLLDEFGKDYGVYFSILSLIASGKTDRGTITSTLQKDIGGQLTRLEAVYGIVKAQRPMFSKPNSRNINFYINDEFLRFWFRFIFKNQPPLEIGNYDYVREVIDRDFSTFAGVALEKFVRAELAATGQYSHVGNYWEKGNQNEIDVIAYNELTKQALIGEVKMQAKKISLDKLRIKAEAVMRKLGRFEVAYRGFSLEDIKKLG